MKIIEILLFAVLYANTFSQNLAIISPGINNEYSLGDRILIAWKDTFGEPLGRVNILFSFNNDVRWPITFNYEPGIFRGLFNWQTSPNMKNGRYKIMIETLYGNRKEFIMNGDFFLAKKESMNEEEQEICYPILLSQGFTKRYSLNLYYFISTFEPIYYFFDNNLGMGLNIGASFVNPNWSWQAGPYINLRLAKDFLKFENIILGKIYFTAALLFQNDNREIFETGFLIDAGLIINLKYGTEFWKNELYLTSGIGINLGLFY